jgi:tetratricopeptide (TPR) repeat protein
MKSSGRWDEMLWIYQNAELKAVSSGDYYSASLRAYNVALIHSYRGQSNDVFRYAALTAEYAKKADLISSAKRNPFVSYIYGVGYKLENNYEIAIKFFKEALSILEGAKDEKSLNARVLNSLAEAELEYGNITDAEEYLIKALHLADDKKDQEGILIYKGNLAELALAQRNWAKAEELGRDALNLAEQLGEQEEIARDNYRTALALMKQGFLSQAYSYAKASVTIYGQLRHKDLSDAQEIYLRCKEEIQKGSKKS